jgi:CRP/FNR family transcriptional regulator, cyclic AMP receptor protein
MEINYSKSFTVLENVIFLKKTSLFSHVQTRELRSIASIAEEVMFKTGDEVVKESDAGDSVYIIKEGRIKITKKAADNKSIDLAEFSVGECFGEMTLFDDEARSASAYAITTCVMLRIARDDLIDVLVEHPLIALELLKIFVKRLRKANNRIESQSSRAYTK